MVRRKRPMSSRLAAILGGTAALCLVSFAYSGLSGNPFPLTTMLGSVIAPLQRGVTGIGNMFERGVSYFTDFDALKAENEALRIQLREMEQQVRDAALALEENDRLRREMGQPSRDRTITTLPAEVIARNPGDWATVLTLDKGSSSGVKKRQVVTTADGLVGFVSEVAPNYCEVTAVTDLALQCGALVTRTRESAIAHGDYDLMTDGLLRLSYLKNDTEVVIGDTVETSGTGGVFPKGIMIGTVENVLSETSGLAYYCIVRPFVDIATVSQVNIITDFTESTELAVD